MKKLFTPIFLLLIGILLIPNQAKASHVMGSDIQWECLGKDKFKIKVVVYRDCNGVQMSNASINFSGNCSGITKSSQTMGPGKDITPVCPGQCTRCKSSGCTFQYGIEAYELVTTIDVKQFKKNGCCEITISWTLCCRNGAITTGAGNQNFYVEAKMNVCKDPCDNSPTFTGDPLAIICLGRDFIYNQGAQDKDVDPKTGSAADSLVYSFGDPMQSAGTKTSWKSPYSTQKPLSYLGFPKDYAIDRFPFGLHLDSVTGDLLFRPMKLEQTVMTVVIEEYRDGKKIGETRRDIQIVVIKCPDNNPPVISGINCSKPIPANFKTEACANEKLCFTVCTSDKDKDDTVKIGWNAGIAGATFTITNPGAKRENGKFCWTPTEQHARATPPTYRFVVDAKDNACPVNGFAARSFTIKVKLPPKAVYDTLLFACGEAEFRAEKRGTVGIGQYLWSIDGKLFVRKGGAGDTLQHKFKNPGRKPFSLTLVGSNGCNVTLSDTMTIPEYVNIQGFQDTTVCAGTDLTFGTVVKYNVGGYKIGWRTDSGFLDTLVSSLKYTVGTESQRIFISVEDSLCPNADTLEITVNNPPKLDLGPNQRICPNLAYEFKPKIKSIDSVKVNDTTYLNDPDTFYTYTWYKNDINSVIGVKSSLSAVDSATYILSVKDSLNCETLDTVDLRVNPTRNWKPNNMQICANDSGVFRVKEKSPVSKFRWWDPVINDTMRNITPDYYKKIGVKVSVDSLLVWPLKTRTYGIEWKETIEGLTCSEYDSVKVVVNPLPSPQISALPALCVDANPLDLNFYGSPKSSTGIWSAEQGKAVKKLGSQYKFDPAVAGADGEATKSHKVFYKYTDANGCSNTTESNIIVKPLPVLELTQESTIMCTNEKPRNLDDYVVRAKGGTWEAPLGIENSVRLSDENGDGIKEWVFDVSNVAPGPKTLYYHFTDTKLSPQPPKCSNMIPFVIDVKKVPEVDAGDYDSICINGNPAILNKQLVIKDKDDPGVGTWIYNGTTGSDSIPLTLNVVDPAKYGVVADPNYHYFTYHFKLTGADCWAQDQTKFRINKLPKPQITHTWPTNAGGRNRICVDDALELTGNQEEDGRRYPGWKFDGEDVSDLGNGKFRFAASLDQDTMPVIKTISYAVTNYFGCTDVITEDVVVDPKATVAFTNNEVCEGDLVQLKSSITNGDLITWSTTGGGSFDDQTIGDPEYTPAGGDLDGVQFLIKLEATNEFTACPVAFVEKKLKVYKKPTITLSFNDTIGCAPFMLQLQPYRTEVENRPEEDVSYITIDYGDGSDLYTSNAAIGTPTHSYGDLGPAGEGTYNLILTAVSDKGCVQTESQEIISLATPEAIFSPLPGTTNIIDPLVRFRNNTVTSQNHVTEYSWDFGNIGRDLLTIENGGVNTSTEKEPMFRYQDTGTYNVKFIAFNTYNTNGREDVCRDTFDKEIRINEEIVMFIPTAFTPDRKGSETNETWKPVTSATNNYNAKIYNRWGELMWESDDPQAAWDGTFKGELVEMDVYVYVVKAKSTSGARDYEFTGTVTLLR